MNLRKLNEKLSKLYEEDELDFDPFRAVTNALTALGMKDVEVKQVIEGMDRYEITYSDIHTQFDDSFVEDIRLQLEQALNDLF